jgi:hypothetical protein
LVATVSQLFPSGAENTTVELTQCPYDHTPIEAEAWSGGSVVLSCPVCGAAWEWHGAWLRRMRDPDRAKVLAARSGLRPTEPAA